MLYTTFPQGITTHNSLRHGSRRATSLEEGGKGEADDRLQASTTASQHNPRLKALRHKGGDGIVVMGPSGRYDGNALPTGTFEKIRKKNDYTTARSLYRENEAAIILAINGYDIELKPGLTTTGKDPDYKIEGKIFDCYSPEPYTGVRSIQSTLDNKVNEKEQADRIVLNLNNWQGNIADVKEELLDYPVANLKEVLVVQDGRVFSIYP